VNDDTVAALQAEFDRLDSILKAGVPAADRAEVKSSIVVLFKRTESRITQLTALKERIRELVNAFKTLQNHGPAVSVRHDHLGASTHIERGWSALAVGDWTMAQSELRRAIGLDSSSTTAQALLGWALMYENRPDDALQLCLQVLVRDPEHGLARVAVGAICLRKGIIGEAIEHLTRVASRSDDQRARLYANFWLGVAYLERDMHSDAIDFLRRAVTQGPNLGEGWTELGRALWLRGEPADARAAWATGAAIRHSPHAARCSRLLETVLAGGAPPRSPFA
jgi:tetratricopeptide (TPR) repeat protein